MKDDDKLFERFKDLLENHEEPYVLGSWERFEKHKQRKIKKQKQKIYFRAAAAILLMSLVSLYIWVSLPDSLPADQITENQPLPAEEDPVAPTDPETPPVQLSEADIELPILQTPVSDGEFAPKTEPDPLPGQTEGTPSAAFYPEHDAVIVHIPLPTVLSSDPSHYIYEKSTALFNSNESEKTAGDSPSFADRPLAGSDVITRGDLQFSDSRTRNKTLTLSVAYASMMNIHDSQTDLGSGAGVYAGWNFAPGFTLSTGLAVSQNNLSYSNREDDFLTAAHFSQMEELGIEANTMSEDHLSSVQVNFLNLEIPLDLRYHISNSFSISAGVSSVTFLRENYDYNFEFAHRTQSFGDEQLNMSSPETVVTYRTTHTQSEPALDAVNWGAFYTFSVGYEHEIFNRYTASFEPFVKLPAGQITSRGVRYSTGGLQLRISF